MNDEEIHALNDQRWQRNKPFRLMLLTLAAFWTALAGLILWICA